MIRTRGEQPTYFSFGIVHVTEVHAMRWTNRNTRRIETFLYAMDTEGTFIHIAVGVNEARVVRAGGDTGLTADALVVSHQYYSATIMNVTCASWATGNTGRIIAMIATL